MIDSLMAMPENGHRKMPFPDKRGGWLNLEVVPTSIFVVGESFPLPIGISDDRR
jgi:hypothetical protein